MIILQELMRVGGSERIGLGARLKGMNVLMN
jgi:hypothetical protein